MPRRGGGGQRSQRQPRQDGIPDAGYLPSRRLSSLTIIKTENTLGRFPDVPRKFSRSRREYSSLTRYAATSRRGILRRGWTSMVDGEPDVAAVSSDRPGLWRARGQPPPGLRDRVRKRVALGTNRDALGLGGRPANDRERDR